MAWLLGHDNLGISSFTKVILVSGESNNCSPKYILAQTCSPSCPCRFKEHYTHLNVVDKDDSELSVKRINVSGRAEHEAIIRDALWCEELGLDQMYEICVYLKRWGSWLDE